MFALGVGAGFEASPGERTVLRLELGDLLLRYPGPAFTKDRASFDDHLWSHNLQGTASVAIRF